jgi:hypothetical protein
MFASHSEFNGAICSILYNYFMMAWRTGILVMVRSERERRAMLQVDGLVKTPMLLVECILPGFPTARRGVSPPFPRQNHVKTRRIRQNDNSPVSPVLLLHYEQLEREKP